MNSYLSSSQQVVRSKIDSFIDGLTHFSNNNTNTVVDKIIGF